MKAKEFSKSEWLYWLLIVLPLAPIIYYWNQFPAMVPGHWNVSGQVDAWYPKEIGLLIGPAINFVMYFLFLALPHIDPRKGNYRLFGPSYRFIRLTLMVFLDFLTFIVILFALGVMLNVGWIVIYLTIIIFFLLGNVMGNIRPNWFIGIRTPWTLESEAVWRKTHRLAAKLWVALSFIMLVISVFIRIGEFAWVYYTYVGIIVLVPVIYSWCLARKYRNGIAIE